MRSIFVMAWANIKNKKIESFLVGLTILVSVMALEIAIGLFTSVNKPFETMASQTKAPHLLIFFDVPTHSGDQLTQWLNQQPEVTAVTPVTAVYSTSSDLISGDRKLGKSVLLSEISLDNPQAYAFKILESSSQQAADQRQPAPGCVWLPKQFAKAKNLELDDIISFPTSSGRQELRVTGLVMDPYFSTSNITPTRGWVGSGSLAEMIPLGDMRQQYLGVRLENASQSKELEQRFKNSLGGRFSGWVMPYYIAKMAYTLFLNMLSVGLLVVALLALFIAITMIWATITSAIYSQYKAMGILKVQGFTPKDVTRVFMIQYLLVGLACLPFGIAIGWVISRMILGQLTNAIGLGQLESAILIPVLLPALIISFILVLSAWMASRKAGSIKPMQAIRFGAPVKKARHLNHKFSWLYRTSPRAMMAFGQLAQNPKRTLFSIAGLVLATLVWVFSINITATFANFSKNQALWGEANSDVNVRLTAKRFTIRDDQFLNLIGDHSAIRAILPSAGVQAVVPSKSDATGTEIYGRAFDGDMQAMGLLNLQGNHPTSSDEIALGVNTAKKGGYDIGDNFSLFLEGQTLNFKVTGIYQTATNLGEGFRIQASAVKNIDPLYQAGTFHIALHDPKDTSAFGKEMKQRFSEAVRVTTSQEDQQEINKILGGMKLSLTLISLLLLGICGVTLINDTLLSIVAQRKTFGIMKTLGMTPGDLRATLAYKAAIMACMSALIGIPLGLLVIPKALSMLAAGIGLVQFPITFHLPATTLLLPALCLFAAGATWLGSKSVTNIQPRQLISN